jgi:hypothetical protein
MEEGIEYPIPDFIINIPRSYKSGILILEKLGPLNISTTRSFESIISVIQKIHDNFKPFLWLHFDPQNENILTATCLHMSYKIYIYIDIESNIYIIDLVNVNMLEDVILKVFSELVIKI